MASSTFSSSLTKEWLSLPHDFSVDDSFADDLIQQFDKKRNSLQDLLNETESSLSPPPPPSPPNKPSSSTNPAAPLLQPPSMSTTTNNDCTVSPPASSPLEIRRRSSAGDVLRRSSATFRSTLDQTWRNLTGSQGDENPQQDLFVAISISTTITLPIPRKSSPRIFPPLQPPAISRYPPRPLQYSPVDYTPSRQKTLMHRLSMPVLRHRM